MSIQQPSLNFCSSRYREINAWYAGINASHALHKEPKLVQLIVRFLDRTDFISFGLTDRRLSIVLFPDSRMSIELLARMTSELLARILRPEQRQRGSIPNMEIGIMGPGMEVMRRNNSSGNDSSGNASRRRLDYYGNYVEGQNDIRHEAAIQNNADDAIYLKSVIDEHLQALPEDEKEAFKKKIAEIDPALFVIIPQLAVKKAISSSVPLTNKNTPFFMHTDTKLLNQLEELRKNPKKLSPDDLWKECGRIATLLSRQTDCIASIQQALQ